MMPNLQQLLATDRLRQMPATGVEIAALLEVVDRDLADASVMGLSADRRFATAYNAALQLATVVIRAEGYRTHGVGHHHTTFVALPLIMGPDVEPTADYLDACRSRRNTVDYDGIGIASERDVADLLAEAGVLRAAVLQWLATVHPELT